ncbi:MAG: DegT/DnrJ/EryC1/StrS family aminotransferase [Candidatus Omnitrophota bacterium]
MKIPLLDMETQTKPIREKIDSAVKRVIDSGSFILGEEVRLLEKEIAAYCKVKYAVAVSNGTDAIFLALKALGIKEGDGVICPVFTYYATAGAVAAIGAVPVFADIDAKTYNISIDSIEKILLNTQYSILNTIKAIIPVHLYGQCADMDAIMKIAKKNNLKVIEDTAQSFGASQKGKKAGTIGDCGTVSFYPGKNLGAFGDAGCIVTNNKAIAEELQLLRNQGASPQDKYVHLRIGHNHRMDSIQAAVLRVKLKHIDKWNKKRAQNAAYYNSALRDLSLITPYVAKGNTHIYHQYVLRATENKEKIRAYLIGKGIDSRTFYPVPLHLQPCFKYLGYKKRDFPEAENCSKGTFVIPVYPELGRKQMGHVIKVIKEAAGSIVNSL